MIKTKLEKICNSSKINGAETEVTISKEDFLWLVEMLEVQTDENEKLKKEIDEYEDGGRCAGNCR